jgi:hypothetical protein
MPGTKRRASAAMVKPIYAHSLEGQIKARRARRAQVKAMQRQQLLDRLNGKKIKVKPKKPANKSHWATSFFIGNSRPAAQKKAEEVSDREIFGQNRTIMKKGMRKN